MSRGADADGHQLTRLGLEQQLRGQRPGRRGLVDPLQPGGRPLAGPASPAEGDPQQQRQTEHGHVRPLHQHAEEQHRDPGAQPGDRGRGQPPPAQRPHP
ncbi:hypothetical protein [uncultured Friedmanniella sp.]|uniref:hypothetical protein n=1 Tax=uncultured Friedmanniella sp. TaxID=335381 RepID=UPI0035C95752